MSEQRRMEYLDALGIEQFVPRKLLLGAKASLALIRTAGLSEQQPAAPVVQAPSVVPLPPTHQPPPTPGPAAELVDRVTQRLINPDAPAAVRPVQRATEVNSTSLVPVQRVLRFALTIWHVPGWLWIDSRQSQQALPTDALLHNLLWALKIKDAVKAEVINWPPVESPIQTQDWAQAREMLHSFLAPRLQPGERLILMGEAAYNACTQGPFDYAERLAEGRLANPNNPAWVFPSLAQMLRQPELKASIWPQLQRL